MSWFVCSVLWGEMLFSKVSIAVRSAIQVMNRMLNLRFMSRCIVRLNIIKTMSEDCKLQKEQHRLHVY